MIHGEPPGVKYPGLTCVRREALCFGAYEFSMGNAGKVYGMGSFGAPVWRAQTPQGFGKAPRRGRGHGCPRPDPATGSRVGQARAPKPRMRGGVRAIRGVFSFVDFSLDKQRK